MFRPSFLSSTCSRQGAARLDRTQAPGASGSFCAMPSNARAGKRFACLRSHDPVCDLVFRLKRAIPGLGARDGEQRKLWRAEMETCWVGFWHDRVENPAGSAFAVADSRLPAGYQPQCWAPLPVLPELLRVLHGIAAPPWSVARAVADRAPVRTLSSMASGRKRPCSLSFCSSDLNHCRDSNG
jgi:hypothetical protein